MQLVGTVGAHEQDAHATQRAHEEGHQLERGPVRPVQVLEHEHQRPLGGQPLHHAEHELDQLRGRRGVGRAGARARVELGQQPGEPAACRSQQLRQLVLGGRARQRPQRVGERRERQPVAAELDAGAAEHAGAARRGGGAQLLDQPGLADAGLAADEGDGGLAVERPLERGAERRELPPAADEDGTDGSGRHPGIVPPER